MIARASATGPSRRAGSPGSGRQDQAVDVAGERDRGRDRVGQDPDPGAAPAHRADDVRLEPEVDDPDQRAAVLGSAPTSMIEDGETWPTKSWSSQRGTARARSTAASRSTKPGSVTIAAERAVGPQVASQGPGVDAGDRRDPVAAEERRELAGVVEDRRRRVGDDEGPEPRPERLVVVGDAAVVADQRIGHHDDLAGVRRVGADLLVAGLRGVDDEVAAGRERRAERDPGEDRAVLEGEQGRPEIADAGIDDRARAGVAAGSVGSSAITSPLTQKRHRPGGARWTRGQTIVGLPSGLTGPVRRPHRTGRQGCPKGSRNERPPDGQSPDTRS